MEITNLVPNINIGFDIPNLKRVVNTASAVMGMDSIVYLLPMRIKQDDNGYVVKQGCEYIIYLNPSILNKDKKSDFNIRLIIHELTHVQQIKEGRLKFNEQQTIAIWDGKEYDNSMPYEYRPWEKEAKKNENRYFKQVKELVLK